VAVSNLDQVWIDIKGCLASITVANGFDITVKEVKLGIHSWEDLKQFPSLSLNHGASTVEDYTCKHAERTMMFVVIGAAQDEPDAFTNLHELVEAVEEALRSETYNPRRPETFIIGTETFRSGANKRTSMMVMDVNVQYEYLMTSP